MLHSIFEMDGGDQNIQKGNWLNVFTLGKKRLMIAMIENLIKMLQQ